MSLPDISTTPTFPALYQIFIHWDPIHAPFALTVRADMTTHDVLVYLSVLLKLTLIGMFLFSEYHMLHLRRRLDDSSVGPGSTLLLKRWSLKQALRWSEEYRYLSLDEARTLYWNFTTSSFQLQHPCPSRQQVPTPVSATTPSDSSLMLHEDEDLSDTPTIPSWIPARGQLADVHHGPTAALLLAYPVHGPAQIPKKFVHQYTSCDLVRLPNHFPTILAQFEKQRLYLSAPSESLSCDIYGFHESVFQHLTLLSHSQLLELTHFRSLLSIWPPAYPWDGVLNPLATEFLPHCHLIVEGGTMDRNSDALYQIMAASASQDLNQAEDRLMLEKGIDERPHRWYATR